jgi:hypothetical protein
MAHQPKALIYIEFKFKNEAVPPFQHMNECALTWLTEWHGEMLLHHLGGRYTGKEGTYDRKAAYQSAALARSPQPLGPRPTGAFPSLSELQATS